MFQCIFIWLVWSVVSLHDNLLENYLAHLAYSIFLIFSTFIFTMVKNNNDTNNDNNKIIWLTALIPGQQK